MEHLGALSVLARVTHDGQMLRGLARPVLYGVDGMESGLGLQRASSVGLMRVGVTVAGSRFLAQRPPTLLADHPNYKSNSPSAIGSAT
jgi:DNA-binding transcriptional LysR family regulator